MHPFRAENEGRVGITGADCNFRSRRILVNDVAAGLSSRLGLWSRVGREIINGDDENAGDRLCDSVRSTIGDWARWGLAIGVPVSIECMWVVERERLGDERSETNVPPRLRMRWWCSTTRWLGDAWIGDAWELTLIPESLRARSVADSMDLFGGVVCPS